ncbi:hypothetical protein LIA77_02000 [Sarocladium implicatum]|nr:hypothetical protein LIA77_02000 [Sarocladium implicatum]
MPKSHILAGVVLFALTPIIYSGFKLHRLHSRIVANTKHSRGRCSLDSAAQPAQPKSPKSLPASVSSDPESWVVHYERVTSSPIALSELKQSAGDSSQHQVSGLTQTYVRAVHSAFGHTPQAFILQSLVKDPAAKATFSPAYLDKLVFNMGDRVNGVYTVVYVGEGSEPGSERVELALDPPEGYSAPATEGRIIGEVLRVKDESDGQGEERVVFANETWMWRKQRESKTLLEGGAGAWIHSLFSGWLILQGIKAVTVSS